MFWKNKGRSKSQSDNFDRKVWGFPCSPDIPSRMKMLADKLQVPLYALAEHALQLSSGLIAKMADSEKENGALRQHLIEMHVERRTIEKISHLDEEMADILDRERAKRLEMEQAVRQIVIKYIRAGIHPQEIERLIDYGMRCRLAKAHKQPMPNDLSPDED